MHARKEDPMSKTVSLDADAFNRGVDEVLRMRPLVRAVRMAFVGRVHAEKLPGSDEVIVVHGPRSAGEKTKHGPEKPRW